MAVRSSVASTLHLFFRLLGLTGLMALFVALVLWTVMPGDGYELFGVVLPGAALPWQIGLGAAVAVLLALLFEIRGVAGLFTSRKAALRSNVLVQVILASVLLAGVNLFSFHNYRRIDLTRDQSFTLPADIRAQLAQLRADTDIIVYQQHVSFGQRADVRQDNYDLAAQKKIVEKVRDLAELFQDLGPRFRVQVLDVQDDDHEDRLEEIRARAPLLGEAIDKAPENTIFFWTAEQKKLQRLSFNDIYQLDKSGSQEFRAGKKKGNLVLKDQGVDVFARKVFNIEEKRPRIGLAVVHELLSVKTADPVFGMPGLKKSLEARGYDYRDIILKKWTRVAPPEPAALTHDENKFERLEAQATLFQRRIKALEEQVTELTQDQKEWTTASLDALNKKYAVVPTIEGQVVVSWEWMEEQRKQRGRLPPFRKIDERFRKSSVGLIEEVTKQKSKDLETYKLKLTRIENDKVNLNIDNLDEQRRIADVRAKLTRMLADIDLLIVPQQTIFDIVREEALPALPTRVHTLEEPQLAAIKDFMKSGKPVMFLLGPTVQQQPAFDTAKDGVAELLATLDVSLPNLTVLFDVEADALGDRTERDQLTGTVEVPGVIFRVTDPEDKRTQAEAGEPRPHALPHAVRASLNLAARAFGLNKPSGLHLRSPRPVYFLSVNWNKDVALGMFGQASAPLAPLQIAGFLGVQDLKKVDEHAVLMMSSDEGWSEEQPYHPEGQVPEMDSPKPGDPKRGKLQSERRGPFPIGVAVETALPPTWYDDGKPPEPGGKVRVAVIGHGGVFIGENLKPMNEKLFLDTANWLMGRDDLLARDRGAWSYPRVELSETENALWQWGTRLGLPLLFAYLGMVMLLVRRMR